MSYSCSVKTVSRSGGRSATAAAAYRNAELIEDQRTGERHDYSRRSGVESVQWFAPAGAPRMTSPELWNLAEATETRRNSTVAREVLVAIPHELDQVQRTELVQRIAQNLADRYGVAGTAAIHEPGREGDQRNWHTHILMTTRQMDPATGRLGAKTRVLDDLKTGPEEVKWIRKMVEDEGNAALVRAGHAARLDSRSLKDQGIDRAPTVHEGPRVTAIRRECEREGREPLGACDVIDLNEARKLPPVAQLQAEAKALDAQIIDLEQRRQVQQDRRAVEQIERWLTQPPPRAVSKAQVEQQRTLQLQEKARQWHQNHPIRSAICRALGISPEVDQQAAQAREAFNQSEARREAARWAGQRQEAERRLQEATERLQATPEAAKARENLQAAKEALRRAEGMANNRITFAELEERQALFQERREIQETADQVDRMLKGRVPPTAAEVRDLADRAGQHQERMGCWDEIEAERRQQALQELQRRAEELQRSMPAPSDDPAPRSRGPRLG